VLGANAHDEHKWIISEEMGAPPMMDSHDRQELRQE
jgi:hypothetical protein